MPFISNSGRKKAINRSTRYSFIKINNKAIGIAKISKALSKVIIETAKNIYSDLMMSLIVRIDFLYDTINEKLYFNEINNIPGSLAFYLFKYKDITINQLIDMCLLEGLKQIENENNKIHSYSNNILNDNIFTNVKFNK